MKKIPKKKINTKNSILNFFGILIIFFLTITGIYALNSVNLISLHFEESTHNFKKSTKEIEIEKELGIKINTEKKKPKKDLTILLVGRGGIQNDAPELTDTIIIAKIHSEKNMISLLSIPRDLYVQYPGERRYGKINSVYSHFLYQKKSEDAAMKKLEEKVEEITGEEIDSYINIDFIGFVNIVDTIGGVEIDVKKRLVDNKYPTKNWGWQTIVFEKGLQTLDGERALMYARSRKTTSDYDRSLRQQQVIEAVREKLISASLLTSPRKIKKIYDVFKKNVLTDISLKKSLELVLNLQFSNSKYETISSNFNDTCYYGTSKCEKGGIIYTPSQELFGSSVALVNGSYLGKISDYTLSRKYANIILNYPKIQKESLKIGIYNGTKRGNLAGSFINDIKKYGFIFPEKNYIGNTDTSYEKSKIYYRGNYKDFETIKALSTFFSGAIEQIHEPKYSSGATDIEIIIGKDYLQNKKIFSF